MSENSDSAEISHENAFQASFPIVSSILNDPAHPFSRFIQRYHINGESVTEHPIKTRSRQASMVGGLAIGSVSGTPWAEPAYGLAHEIILLGVLFASDTIVVFGFGACWVWYKVVNDIFETKTPEEKEMLSKTSLPIRIIKAIAREFLSLITAIPSTYTAFRFNTIKALASIVFIDTYAFSRLGFSYLFKALGTVKDILFRIYFLPLAIEKRLFKLYLQETYHDFINMSPEERASYLSNLQTQDEVQVSPTRYVSSMFANRNQDTSSYVHQNMRCLSFVTFAKYAGFIAGFAVCVINFIADTIMSNQGAEDYLAQIWILNLMLALITSLPGLSLRILSMLDTVNEIGNALAYRLSGDPRKSFVGKFYPVLAFLIPIVAVGLAVPSTASQSNILSEIFSGSGFGFSSFILAGVSSLQEIVYETFLLRKLFHLTLETYTRYVSNNQEAKEVLAFGDKIKSIETATEELPNKLKDHPEEELEIDAIQPDGCLEILNRKFRR